MLWRAGGGRSRHFFPLALQFQPRCFPYVNFALSTPPLRRESGHSGSEPTSGFTGKIPRSLLSKFSFETSKFLTLIEELYMKDTGRDQLLKQLQGTFPTVLSSSKTACTFAQELVANNHPNRALHVLHICHRLGIAMPHNRYEQVAYQLASRKHWDLVHRVAVTAERQTGRWTTRLLNWAIRSDIETQRYAFLSKVMDLFKRDNLEPSRNTFHLLVRGHLQNADLPRARMCLAAMQDAGFKVDKSTYISVLGAYRVLGSNEAIEERAFQALRGIGEHSDTIILNGLMRLRMDAGDADGALRVLELFARPPLIDGELGAYGTTSQSSSLRVIPATSPDIATYNILLAFLAPRKVALPDVLRVFRQIPAMGLRPDADSVSSLIHAHFSAGKNSVAVAIVAGMCTFHNVPIDPKEFKVIGRSADQLGDALLHALFVRPTTRVFNTLLQGVLPKHGFVGMRCVFRMMQQAAIFLDASTIEIILSYLQDVQSVRPRTLLRVLRTLAAFPVGEATPTIRHANSILRSLLSRERDIIRTKSWNATAQRVRLGHRSRFKVERLSKPARTFDPTAGISLESFNRSVRRLFRPVIQTLLDNKVMSNSITFALSIRRNAVIKMDMDAAQRVFDVMVARGIRPNAYHFSALMEGYVAQGDMDGAGRVMGRAALARVPSNVVMYTILIIGHGRQQRPDLALRTFADMKRAGVDPDFAAIDAVVSAFWVVKRYRDARTVLLDLWPLVAPLPPDSANMSLRALVQSFRALRTDERKAVPTSDSPRYRRQRLRAEREISRTLRGLVKWRKREGSKEYDEAGESLSWSKEYFDLSPMLRNDVS